MTKSNHTPNFIPVGKTFILEGELLQNGWLKDTDTSLDGVRHWVTIPALAKAQVTA